MNRAGLVATKGNEYSFASSIRGGTYVRRNCFWSNR